MTKGILAVLLLVAPAAMPAQSTPTEREAAATILKQIDALQAQIDPTGQAKRLLAAGGAERDRILARVEELWSSQYRALSDHIGRNPEVGFREFRSVDTLTRVLRAAGFTVTTGQAGLETAFVGSWDSPAGTGGPTLGVIVEYDALRGTKDAFHGCQHNAQSPVGFAAAIAVMEHMRDRRLPGRIRVFGTPAEEVGPPSKVTMWKAGVFEGTDILVRSHGTGETARARAGFGVCCLNINEVKYIFEGTPAHQRQSWNGRNALSAAVQFYSAVDHLRPTFRPETSIQGVIPEGGVAPNVVPDRAVVDYYLRYPDEVYLAHIDSMVANAARGAALATGTKVTIDRYGEYRDGITIGSLEELVFAYAEKLGAPNLKQDKNPPDGYEETGFLTREIPGVGVGVFSSPAPGHSYARFEDSLKDVGHTGFLYDARIMAAVLYHFLSDSKFRETVKAEHKALSGWFDEYLAGLKRVYAEEIARREE
ncbi:MAG TPA: peptidase dimerization domain-containing protein [Gemmatimonadaceae bacterium]